VNNSKLNLWKFRVISWKIWVAKNPSLISEFYKFNLGKFSSLIFRDITRKSSLKSFHSFLIVIYYLCIVRFLQLSAAWLAEVIESSLPTLGYLGSIPPMVQQFLQVLAFYEVWRKPIRTTSLSLRQRGLEKLCEKQN
jgi:hypothetical protein